MEIPSPDLIRRRNVRLRRGLSVRRFKDARPFVGSMRDLPMRDQAPLRQHWQWPPLDGRLPRSGSPTVLSEIEKRHRLAVERNQSSYTDPVSILTVFTALFLASRRYCCDSGCRHCPYEPDET